MAEAATDQSPAAPVTGGQPSESAAATSLSAGDASAAPAIAPPTSTVTEKAEDPSAAANVSSDTTDPATAPFTETAKEATGSAPTNDAAAASAKEDTAAPNGTPSSSKKSNNKRKSISEPKGKSLKKKQSMRELHLDATPGQLWWVRMKGYPNWPAIVCDEDMLPATLLEKRPVSAARTDGSYREDFMDGGKNARDRRYPVMFLGTNEFYWQVNTDLMPLDIQEIKDEVSKGERGKKSILLWNAYEIAAEEHDLDYFKGILKTHEEQLVQELQEKAERDAKKAEKEAKKDAKKNKTDADGDVDMEGADGGSTKKKKAPTKKRKEPAGGEAEEEQKGPKKIRIKNKGAAEADTEPVEKTKKEKKPKSKAAKDDTPAKPEEPQLTDAQKLEKKEKQILYLRHRLQKGFISRDHPPKEDEMADMANHLKALEEDPNLEVSIIRGTKINKVLKAILKIESIPKEEVFNFKSRSAALLSKWNAILGTPAEPSVVPEAPKVNGEAHADAAAPKVEKESSAAAEKADEPAASLGNGAKTEGDVSMADAKPSEPEAASKAPEASTSEDAKTEVPPAAQTVQA